MTHMYFSARAAYRTAISAAQILVSFASAFSTRYSVITALNDDDDDDDDNNGLKIVFHILIMVL